MSDEGLTHLGADGSARMVDVGDKAPSQRTAQAIATVSMSPDTAARVVAGDLPKGDVAAVVRLAGIQAAKRTSELIPLCHQIALDAVDVALEVDPSTGEATLRSEVRATDRTGVEMEALVAVSVAALTLYDMVKAVQRDVVVGEVRLVAKTGGTRGDFRSP